MQKRSRRIDERSKNGIRPDRTNRPARGPDPGIASHAAERPPVMVGQVERRLQLLEFEVWSVPGASCLDPSEQAVRRSP